MAEAVRSSRPRGGKFCHAIRMWALPDDLCVDDTVAGYNLAELAYIAIRTAFGDLIEHLLAADYSTERRGIAIKFWRCDQRNKELAARLSRTILNCGDRSTKMTARAWQIRLIRDQVTGTAQSIVRRIGILRIWIAPDNPMACLRPVKRRTIVKTCFH